MSVRRLYLLKPVLKFSQMTCLLIIRICCLKTYLFKITSDMFFFPLKITINPQGCITHSNVLHCYILFKTLLPYLTSKGEIKLVSCSTQQECLGLIWRVFQLDLSLGQPCLSAAGEHNSGRRPHLSALSRRNVKDFSHCLINW